jgi:hypothetical protein
MIYPTLYEVLEKIYLIQGHKRYVYVSGLEGTNISEKGEKKGKSMIFSKVLD